MSRVLSRSAFVASLLLVAACGGGTATTAPTTAVQSQAPASEPPSAAAGPCAPAEGTGEVSVTIANFAFDPATVTAKVDDVISFTNNDSVQHTATVKSDESCTTPELAASASGGITFSQAGSYDFFCKIHPQMTGKIEVTS
jgi:plastocyanin